MIDWLKKISVVIMLVSLMSCGGGGNYVASVPTSADHEPPEILSVTLTQGDVGNMILTNEQGLPSVEIKMQASDNIDVTAYCITSNATPPTAKSSCFAQERSWVRIIGPSWYVWARDAAGNISTAARAPGPCSAEAVSAAKASTLPTVCMRTDAGEIVIELENTKAPESANNFAQYVSDGFYAGTIFHRILSNFMVQGGGFAVNNGSRYQKTATEGLRSSIALEKTSDTGLSNVTGTVAMARTNEPNSATSQFFINLVDNNKTLDADGSTAPGNGYAVFGKVIYGIDTTVQTLRNAQVVYNGQGETSSPVNNIFIQWAYLLN